MSRRVTICVILIAALVVGAILWRYVGFRPPHMSSNGTVSQSGNVCKPQTALHLAVDAYNRGRYKEAERAALEIVRSSANSSSDQERTEVAKARYILAFSAARQKNMRLARDRFDILKREAAKLPDKGMQTSSLSAPSPTLEQEGAYQHAVCTAALGDKKAAEAEYMQFIRDYPESPLLNGAAKRIEMLHGGHLPAAAEAIWTEASRIAQTREAAKDKELRRGMSSCGPECLAEILRRQGVKSDMRTLAEEMKTTDRGTSLLALAKAAKKHGLSAKGVALTWRGLTKQPLPLIALVYPGHYVIVDDITPAKVTVWYPYANGIGKPATRRVSRKAWESSWCGAALVLRPQSTSSR